MKWMFLVMTCALIFSAGCGKKSQEGWGEMVIPVVAVLAKQQAVEETIEAIGTLAANESVDVQNETDGTIEAIHFDEGQQVEEGQVLVELDRTKLGAALAETQANLKMAAATHERYAALLESGAVARQEADQAQATWVANQALVDRLTAELEEATIRAPFKGIAGGRWLSIGQFIPRGTRITMLTDFDPMKLEFRIPERFLTEIKLKQSVALKVAAYPETAFKGEVYFIDPQVDLSTRTVLLKAMVPNPQGQLRPGMFAHVELILRVKEQAVVIPETALLHQGEMVFVYAIDNEQKAQMRLVKTGVRLADSVEITEGLNAGEQVVAEGHQKLHPGAKVIPRQTSP